MVTEYTPALKAQAVCLDVCIITIYNYTYVRIFRVLIIPVAAPAAAAEQEAVAAFAAFAAAAICICSPSLTPARKTARGAVILSLINLIIVTTVTPEGELHFCAEIYIA